MTRIAALFLCALLAASGAADALPWTIETVDSSGHAGQYASLAIDAGGVLHLCYYDSLCQDLLYARRSGGAWSYGAIDTAGDVGRYCAITVGSNNYPRVSYFDSTNRALKYGVFNGSTWTTETADPGPGVGQHTSLALDQSDRPCISYYAQAVQDLRYATKPAGTWNRTVIDNSGEVGRYSSVVVNGEDKPRISYYSGAQQQLQFAYMKNTNWKKEYPDPAVGVGTFTSMVVDSSDSYFIAYQDSARGWLRMAGKPGGGSWSVDTVDNSGAVGGFTSIAANKAGQPVVSYFDRINADLRFAEYSGTVWTLESIDTAGTVGLYTSCRVSSDSTVYIAYFDQTHGRLKLARTVPPDTLPPGPPQGLTANGANPSPWGQSPGFALDWTNPPDSSGIGRALYKLGSPPASDYDTTGSLTGTPPDSVTATAQGGQPLYLWLEDGAGNASCQNSATVLLRYDATAPSVASTIPAGGDTGVALNANCVARFSEPMDPASMVPANFTVVGSASGTHSAAISYAGGDSAVTLNPSVDFSTRETVTVTVRREVADLAGNQMAADHVWSFLTGTANDTVPPGPPQGLTANGANQSPWSGSARFCLDWSNPPDSGGIGRSLYKLGSAPTFNFDTTGSLRGTPPDSVTATAQGGQILYLWLEDGAGNTSYQNNATAALRYDGTPPAGSVASSPPFSNIPSFSVDWTAGSDAGGSGLSGRYAVRIRDGAGSWSIWLSDTAALSAAYGGADGHRYYFEAGAVDSAGNVEAFTAAPECSTLVDLTAPTVASTFPAGGDTGVAVNVNCVARFSEPMDPASMVPANFAVVGSASGTHGFTVAYSGVDTSVTLSPSAAFAPRETVTVTVRREAADQAGNLMVADYAWSFVTGSRADTLPPRIVQTVPDSAEANVVLNPWILATFSERVDPATVTGDKVLIRGSINGIYPFWMSYGTADSTLYVSAYSNFAPFESVNVYIAPGIRDLNGNTMTNSTWWWFRTGAVPDTAAPRVAAIDISPDTAWLSEPALLTARITDNRTVFYGEYFVDSAGSPGTGLPATPVDSFGQASVEIRDTIFTYSLPVGRHWVFLHGLDASGLWGAFDSASFFRAGPDTVCPSFAIMVLPEAPSVGTVLSVSVRPSEPLHPDSAVSCTLRASDGSLRPVALSPDSIGFSASLQTEGLPAGPCRLTVSGYDRWTNRGSSHADFALSAAGEFLPEDMVYVWPNPARGGQVNFHYYVNANATVTAEVFALDGRRIASLTGHGAGGRPPHQANSNAVVWDIGNVASDVYILRLTAVSDAGGERKTVVRKFAIVK